MLPFTPKNPQAFEGYLKALGNQEFQQAATELENLQDALRRLSETASPAPPGAVPIPGPQ